MLTLIIIIIIITIFKNVRIQLSQGNLLRIALLCSASQGTLFHLVLWLSLCCFFFPLFFFFFFGKISCLANVARLFPFCLYIKENLQITATTNKII